MLKRFFTLTILLLMCFAVSAQQTFSEIEAEHIARQYLLQQRSNTLLSDAETNQLVVSKIGYSKKSGITHVYFTQTINGIEIYNAVINVHINKNGEVISWGDRSVKNTASKNRSVVQTTLSPEQAIVFAARALGYSFEGPIEPVKDSKIKLNQRLYGDALVFSNIALSLEDIPVRQKYVVTDSDELRLTWDLSIAALNKKNWWSVRVDAMTGAILSKSDWVRECNFGDGHLAEGTASHIHHENCSDAINFPEQISSMMDGASYRVYVAPFESPISGGRSLVVDPSDPIASPFGWHDTDGVAGPEFTITRGNNVHAYTDTNADNMPDPGSSPDGGAALVFDFAIDLAQAPSSYRPAAVTNLFYFNNFLHDWSYQYGFDEANGNFQVNNYGNGGVGNDDVRAEAQDGSEFNNARFGTPEDGMRPRMSMYLWDITSPMRDGDLDNLIIGHEFGHGVSNRLTGPTVECLDNTEQMGEGWSDFIGIVTTWRPGTNATSARGVGAYVLGQGLNGAGIRPTRYSFDMAINPATYDDIKTAAVPHGIGYVWNSMLWDITILMIERYGEAAGLDRTVTIVMEGLMLQPCSPGFIDGRDAILLANQAIYGGESECLIWQAFARRGLGFSASQGSSASRADGTEAFDIPNSIVASASAFPNPICNGNTLNLSASGGSTYAWSGPGGFISNLQNPTRPNILVAHSGVYTVTVTSAQGCTGIASVNVVVNQSPVASALASPNPICSGNTLNLSASGGSTYAWSGPGGFTSNLQNPTRANILVAHSGVYTVTVTSALGCTATATVNVIVNQTPIPTASAAPNPICSGNTLSLSSTGGTGYAWSGPGGYTSNLQNPTRANVQVAHSGVYTVTVTSSQGCTATATVNVIVNQTPTPTIGATPNPVCVNSILYLTSGGGATYAWTGPESFASSNQNPARWVSTLAMGGLYSVVVTSAAGCPATTSVSVTVHDVPMGTIDAQPNPVCVGESLALSATGGVAYTWSGPAGFASGVQNPSVSITQYNQRGNYQVTVTNIHGCSSFYETFVEVVFPPIASAAHDISTACVGSDLHLFSTGAGSYQWSGPVGFASYEQNPVVNNVTEANSGIYTVTVTSPNGCTALATTTVSVEPLPVFFVEPTETYVCEGSTVTLKASGAGSYSWTGPWGWTSTFQNPIILNIPTYMTGTYTATLTGTTGCASSQSVQVFVSPFIVGKASATPNPACAGASVKLFAEGGTNYLWTGPDGFYSSEQNPRIDNMNNKKAGTYGVLITNKGGCQDFVTVEVDLIPGSIPVWAYATPNPTSEGKSVQFFSSNGISHVWTGPNQFSSTEQNPVLMQATRKAAGVYSVIVGYENGCTSIAKVNLHVNIKKGGTQDGIETDPDGTLSTVGIIYPNPANDYIQLEVDKPVLVTYSIYDFSGRLIQSSFRPTEALIELVHLSSGAYFVRWKEAGSDVWKHGRFVKL